MSYFTFFRGFFYSGRRGLLWKEGRDRGAVKLAGLNWMAIEADGVDIVL